MNPVFFDIQKYSLHDGEGIRTTFFVKGCPLSCRWCHNPESQGFFPELLFREDKCVRCGRCAQSCPQNAIFMTEDGPQIDRKSCVSCGKCAGQCFQGALSLCGRTYTTAELLKEALKDRMFYEQSGGGVTFSGGEIMVQDLDSLLPLFSSLRRQGISLYFDTCGHAPYTAFEKLLPYADAFLYDIKLMDAEAHRAFTGQDNTLILKNLCRLSEAGAKLCIRIPVIGGVNAEDAFFKQVIAFLKEKKIKVAGVNLLPYHATGSGKYPRLGLTYDNGQFTVPCTEEMGRFASLFSAAGIPVKIGG